MGKGIHNNLSFPFIASYRAVFINAIVQHSPVCVQATVTEFVDHLDTVRKFQIEDPTARGNTFA